MSSLITTTLTYHLGWVTTCFPLESNYAFCQKNSYNSLWIQISELSGALGCPAISCRTIITASKRNSVISEILHSLNYFVRFSKVEYTKVERSDIDSDNKIADAICRKAQNVIDQRDKLQHYGRESCYFNLSVENNGLFTKPFTVNKKKPQFTLGDDENSENNYDKLENYGNSVACDQIPCKTMDTNNMNTLPIIQVNCENLPRKGMCKIKSSFLLDCRESKSNSLSRIPTFQQMKFGCYGIPTKLSYDDDAIQSVIPTKQEHNYNKNSNEIDAVNKLRVLVFPLPSQKTEKTFDFASFESVLRNDSIGKYIPDMVIQGTVLNEKEFDGVKREPPLAGNNLLFDRQVDDDVTVIGDLDKWKVNIYSSSTKHCDSGPTAEISPLVENMLDITLQMWYHHLCPNYCATHIEQRLLEICLHSLALANLLLDTDFCVMDLLTSTLHLQVNDIPLLLSVASVVTPQVTKKYGLSFQ